MKHYGFTEPRKPTRPDRAKILANSAELDLLARRWHVGEALGLDALIRTISPEVIVRLGIRSEKAASFLITVYLPDPDRGHAVAYLTVF